MAQPPELELITLKYSDAGDAYEESGCRAKPPLMLRAAELSGAMLRPALALATSGGGVSNLWRRRLLQGAKAAATMVDDDGGGCCNRRWRLLQTGRRQAARRPARQAAKLRVAGDCYSATIGGDCC
jgi:hypothetical protein